MGIIQYVQCHRIYRFQADDQQNKGRKHSLAVVVVIVEVIEVVDVVVVEEVLIISHFSLTILFTASWDNLKFFFNNAQH